MLSQVMKNYVRSIKIDLKGWIQSDSFINIDFTQIQNSNIQVLSVFQ